MTDAIWTEADQARADLIAEIACEISENEDVVAMALDAYDARRDRFVEHEALRAAMPKIKWLLTAVLEGDPRAILLAAEELNRHVPVMNAALAKAASSQTDDTPQVTGAQDEGERK